MSTYLIAFVVSDFDYKKDEKEIVYRVFSAPKDVNQTAYALEEGEAILNAIEKYVEVPFTMPKMDQVAIYGVPNFNSSGKCL